MFKTPTHSQRSLISFRRDLRANPIRVGGGGIDISLSLFGSVGLDDLQREILDIIKPAGEADLVSPANA